MRRLIAHLSLLLMLIALNGCGTFIGNPDRISADGPDTKDKQNESLQENSDADEGIAQETTRSGTTDSGVIIIGNGNNQSDEYDEVATDVSGSASSMEKSTSVDNIKLTKSIKGLISTDGSNRQILPLGVSTSSVEELKTAIAANAPTPLLMSEDFVDYFSDFPKESFDADFNVSHNMSESLFGSNTYLLSIVIDTSILTDTPFVDVKSIIEFNASVVAQFSLIGYEHDMGQVIDDNLSLNEFSRGERKTLAFEVTLKDGFVASDSFFAVNLSYMKASPSGQYMSNSITVSHDLSDLNTASQAQILLNASIALAEAINGSQDLRAQSLTEVQSYLATNRAAEPSAKWLELEDILNSLNPPN